MNQLLSNQPVAARSVTTQSVTAQSNNAQSIEEHSMLKQASASAEHCSLIRFGNAVERVNKALAALQAGQGVLLVDDEDRENEGDLIFSTQFLCEQQMAMLIRECSGIVCLCLTEEKINQLKLPMMVDQNTSRHGTAFTVSIEAARGVTTGVSAKDRVTTVRAATSLAACESDLSRPGHIFPLKAHKDGVLGRRGHTEGTIDLMKLANLEPAGVLCELTNKDGTMAKLPQIISFAEQHEMVVLSVEDIVQYRCSQQAIAS
ncbi:3,4-dihydroxy-2-butanone-4-phosphate synthase [Aliikangiella sp. G2MR2-5]|uniref:3,4-dihydroxy-2-butanone-4-phosphate synthase n=1 Tax=Aliikangiella sp. G2MR2-5 TaxID=2788943 RepID=UPI001FF01EA8|nr:3,4-dihydroxy-2-butanone-4-phosphate synthase [Aliikangiella sp. G2MR2-5]